MLESKARRQIAVVCRCKQEALCVRMFGRRKQTVNVKTEEDRGAVHMARGHTRSHVEVEPSVRAKMTKEGEAKEGRTGVYEGSVSLKG